MVEAIDNSPVVESVLELGRIRSRVEGFVGFERLVVAGVGLVEGSTQEESFVGVLEEVVVVVLEALESFAVESRVVEGIQDWIGRRLGTLAGFESGLEPVGHRQRRRHPGNW